MVAATAPGTAPAHTSTTSAPRLFEERVMAAPAIAPAAPVTSRPARLQARPIPVAAYPAGVPRWVTYAGRRQRVVAVHDQLPLDPRLAPLPRGARRLQVRLADGRLLTLVHNHGGWFERG